MPHAILYRYAMIGLVLCAAAYASHRMKSVTVSETLTRTARTLLWIVQAAMAVLLIYVLTSPHSR